VICDSVYVLFFIVREYLGQYFTVWTMCSGNQTFKSFYLFVKLAHKIFPIKKEQNSFSFVQLVSLF